MEAAEIKGTDTGFIPLHLAQQEVYFDQVMDMDSPHYNVGGYLVMKGGFDPERFKRAVQQMVDVSDVFRLSFDLDGEAPSCKLTQGPVACRLAEMDYSSESAPAQTALGWMQQRFNTPFDLNGPLYEQALIKIGPAEFWWYSRNHHLIMDGYSFPILAKYVASQYVQDGFGNGSTDQTPSYWDEVRTSTAYLASEDYRKDDDYWRKKFTTIPDAFLKKKYDPVNGAVRSESAEFTIDEELRSALESVKQQASVDLQQLLIAALAIYFYKAENWEQFVCGLSIHNRTNRRQRHTIGMFAGVIPFQCAIDPGQTLLDFLNTIKSIKRNDYRYLRYPISHLNRQLQMMANGRLQLFDVAINYSVFDFHIDFGDLEATTFELTSQLETTPLHFYWRDYGIQQPSRAQLNYQTAYFSREDIDRVWSQLLRILQQFPGHLTKPVSSIELVTEEERRKLLVVFNDTARIYPKDLTMVELIEAQAARTPDAVAVEFEDRQLTYQGLNEGANRMARYLQSRGVMPGALVPICINRGLEMMLGILGIMKAGAAYVPIDPSYPAERINYILEDTAPQVVLTSRGAGNAVPSHQRYMILEVDSCLDAIEKEAGNNLESLRQPHSCAYVIYTSGSTGRPKGVMIDHQALVNRLMWAQEYFRLTPEDTVLQKTTFCFDVSVWELLWPLFTGSRLVFARPGYQGDNDYLKRTITRYGITVLHFVPSALDAFLADLYPGECACIKKMICSGEELRPGHVGLFRDRLPHAELHNLYGPTEAAIDVTYWTRPADHADDGLVPIGRPVANTRIYILNRDNSLTPPGGTGELHIGGIQLALGYLNREELTAQKFIPDPFSDQPGDRLYKTGDLAKWLGDGNIQYLGRMDDQVKIRGYRIEPGEIEQVLEQHEMVNRAVVLASNNGTGNKQLIAYILPSGFLDLHRLRSWLQDTLPGYMVPDRLIEISNLPLTANGKVDRRRLPDPEITGLPDHYAAPQSHTEIKLAEGWRQLLNRQQIGIRDNFFEMGGNSLLATRLISYIRKTWGTEIAIKDLFRYSTISLLAGYLDRHRTLSTMPALTAAPHTGAIPLSYGQERLWFLHELEGSIAYHMPAVFRLKGPLQREALADALRSLVNRHEVIRTVIQEENDIPVQKVLGKDNWSLEVIDNPSGMMAPDGLGDLIREKITLPFDLSADHMLRASLVEVGRHENVLIINMHHIASDGWSVNIIVRELKEYYEAYTESRPNRLAIPVMQYADYAIWQRNYLQEDLLSQKLAFWIQQLDGAAPLNLPLDHPRPAVLSTKGAATAFIIPEELAGQVKSLALQHQVTLFMTLLAAFKVLLWRYGGESDISVGVPVAGRMVQELEEMVGLFVNTIVLRSTIDPDLPFTHFLNKVKATTLQATEHQDTPFEKVVEVLAKHRDRSRSPLFQVMFVMQDRSPAISCNLGEVQLFQEATPQETAKSELTFYMSATGEGLTGTIEYSTDLFSKDTIVRMAQHYEKLLTSIIEDPGQAIKALPMMCDQDRHHILTTFNNTRREYEEEETILDLLARQVAGMPDDIALVCEESSITYRQLHERSNQLGHYLRQRGIGEENRVPVCIGRSIDMVIAVMGILKAGAAYVPLDPSYPADRIAYILEDAGAALILTSGDSKRHIPSQYQDRIIEIDLLQQDIDGQSRDGVPNALTPGHLSYVIYTSGSTGKPKGVMITHRNTYAFICWCLEEFRQDPIEWVYAVTSLCFDLSVFELLYPLSAGKKIRLVKDVLSVGKHLENDGGVLLNCVPSVIQMLLDTGVQLTGVSAINMAGEPVPPELCRAPGLEPIVLRNLYGPTEDTTYSTLYRLRADGPVLIGTPIANKHIYILDSTGGLCPIGIPGEICIGGAGVSRGYLNLPELTAEKFVPDPFSSDKGERIYKTGDLGRWLSDGNIVFMGRMDDQVKIRGYRIELGEIEQVILQTGIVRQAIVLAKTDAAGASRLIAYVIPYPGNLQLMPLLKKKLPDYMLPTFIVELEQFPLTPNGKIDKHQLPDPIGQVSTTNTAAEPINETETTLVHIWQEVLGREQIGVNDNFFELGGHSLMAMKLNVQMQRRLNQRIEVGNIFSYPTIRELGHFITGRKMDEPVSIMPAPLQEHYACSHAQKRIWILSRFKEGSSAYNVPGVIALKGDLQLPVLKLAFDMILSRHENLRTAFIEVDGEPRQKILSPETCSITIEEFGELPDPVARVEDWMTREATHTFDLSRPPLIHIALFHTRQKEGYLAFNMHHIICDDWAREVIINEFVRLYEQYTSGAAMELPPLPIQYKDYAGWHNNFCLQYGKYWESLYKDHVPVLRFPLDFERPGSISFAGDTLYYHIPEIVRARLTDIASARNMTLNNLLLALYGLHTAHYSLQEEVVIGSLVSGRDHPGIEELTGVFINFLPVKLTPGSNLSLDEYLRASNLSITQAYSHQDYPFDLIVEACAGKRAISRNPLFDTMLNFHWKNQLQSGITLDTPGSDNPSLKIKLDRIPGKNGAQAVLDFKMDIETVDTGLDAYLNYNTHILKKQRMVDFFQQFMEILEKVTAGQDKNLVEYTGYELPAPVHEPLRIVVSASFVIEPVQEYLEYWSRELNLNLNISIAPYNQLFQQLLHASSLLRKNDGINIIFIRMSDWLLDQGVLTEAEQIGILDRSYPELVTALEELSLHSAVTCLTGILPPSDSSALPEVRDHINRLNRQLQVFIEQRPFFHLIDLSYITTLYKTGNMFDPITDRTAHMPFTEEYYAALGTFLSRKIFSRQNQAYKVIALDCDNTLWKGICGEDGPTGIEIGSDHLALQEFLLEKYHKGFLLVLCSKNNEEDVWEVFRDNPHMLIRREHIAAWRINWKPKPDNIRELAGELGLGTDSFIFIDDSSFETEQMTACCPNVLSLTLPSDTGSFRSFIDHIWAFDRFYLTAEDVSRNAMYQAERLRQEEQSKFDAHEDFIRSLDVRVDIERVQENDLERLVQLMWRTNQFNLNGKRLTAREIALRLQTDETLNWTIRVADRFGDYGLTGMVLAMPASGELILESFLLSCRVLGKKVEDEILTALHAYCNNNGLDRVRALFADTGRNKPFSEFITRTGWVVDCI
ncbi:MAG TPA: amino acid adenylation domain-containing protein [Puia sp.]|nr:amino acid adenylation domain-containing protein [Puia sp.]